MLVVVSEIFSTVLLMDCELFEVIAVKIIYTHLHILLIFFMKADLLHYRLANTAGLS